MSEQQTTDTAETTETETPTSDHATPGNNSAGAAGGGVGDPVKDPSDWVTGGEPMTGPQKSYLETLAREAGRELPTELDKADASRMIDELQQETGRGA